MDSKRYNNIKLGIGIAKGIVSFLLAFVFVATTLSYDLVKYLSDYSSNNYLLLVLYTCVIGVFSAIIFFPVNYYVSFYLEHKCNLSNQTFVKWVIENFKGMLVGVVIGIPILLLFFFILNEFKDLWWLLFSILMFIISVVLAQVMPIVILPIFYKIVPIENDELKSRISKLAGNVGMKIENVFKFDMSKNTKKANAAFTGLGKTKRIILGDTLLEDYSIDEIETVLAHEFGHYKHKHIVKNIFISTLFSFLTFFVIAKLYSVSYEMFGYSSITEIAALPLLTLWATLIGLIQTPISNIISRKFEYEADEYAIKTTGKKEEFLKTLEKLTEQNKGDKEPHPFVEWFYYSHPSIKKRSNFINSIKI